MRLSSSVAYVAFLPGKAPTPLPGPPSPDGSASDAPPEVAYSTPPDVGQTMYSMAANTASHDSPSRPARGNPNSASL
eukprot:320990-Rhodomonas_salina.1